MNKKRESNSIGIVYLVLILGNIIVCAVGYGLKGMGYGISTTLLTFICELFILGPVLIYLRAGKEKITESLGFHKIKISTILLTVLLTIAVTPIYIFANVLSQIFVSNIMVQNSGDMIEGAILSTMLVTSVMAPLFEEIAFRGFFYNKLRDRSSVLKAAIISAVLFGLMHLNLNQFCYAVVLGFVFALADQASGSIWTSVIMHFLINVVNVGLILLSTLALREQNVDLAQAQEAARIEPGAMLTSLAVLGGLSIICVFIVWFLLKAIARNQGNLDSFKAALARKKTIESEHVKMDRCVLNIPMLTSIFVGIAAMAIFQFTVF